MENKYICQRCKQERRHLNVGSFKGEDIKLCENCKEDFEHFMEVN